MTVTHYATGPDPFMVDLDWYENLPEDLQQIFDAVAIESIRYSDELSRIAEAEMIDKLESVLEVNYLNGSDLQPFRELAQQVYQYFIDNDVVSAEEVREAASIAQGASEELP